LTPEEREALIPSYIVHRSDLNEAEQVGINDADRWAFSRKRNLLSEDFIRQLHRRMFNQTYAPDEIAVRFHHRLVFIHPFPNGNGRLSRLAADLLVVQFGRERFSWGSGNLTTIADLRKRYVDALRAADGHEIEPLIIFARS
jgi:fido (protein-threonine AMPylation protein)